MNDEQTTKLKLAAKACLAFGQARINLEMGVMPIVMAIKPNSDGCLIMSPRQFDEESKFNVMAMMAVAARAWGGTDVVLMTDAFYRRFQPDEHLDLDDVIPPSQDPAASEALMVHVFRADGGDFGQILPYHRGPEGIRFDQPEDMPVGHSHEVDAPDRQGMMPMIIHSALSKTDEEIAEAMRLAPVSIGSFDEMVQLMEASGYAVVEE